jgi:phosphomannomutase
MKVAVDASNGMAGKVVPAIFGQLPVQIVGLNFEHAGKFKHEPDPLVGKNLSEVKSAVKKNKCDFGVCFDGDADRLMVVDEKASIVGCDLLATLMVAYFFQTEPKSTVVYDLRSSRVLVEEIIKHGGTPRRERVGQAFMKKALRDSHAVFGCGLSGHFCYRDNYGVDSGMITLVHIINIVSEGDTPLSERIAPLRRYHGSGEISVEVANKQIKLEELARRYSDGQIDHLDGMTIGYKDWWFNCQPSNTEPLLRLRVEAKSKELLDQKLSEMTEQLGKPA